MEKKRTTGDLITDRRFLVVAAEKNCIHLREVETGEPIDIEVETDAIGRSQLIYYRFGLKETDV